MSSAPKQSTVQIEDKGNYAIVTLNRYNAHAIKQEVAGSRASVNNS